MTGQWDTAYPEHPIDSTPIDADMQVSKIDVQEHVIAGNPTNAMAPTSTTGSGVRPSQKLIKSSRRQSLKFDPPPHCRKIKNTHAHRDGASGYGTGDRRQAPAYGSLAGNKLPWYGMRLMQLFLRQKRTAQHFNRLADEAGEPLLEQMSTTDGFEADHES